MSGYNVPALSYDDVPVNLVPESQEQQRGLLPTTPVLAMNRARLRLSDMFDGEVYQIPAGPQKFWIPYGAALHFQRRLIVPGTRTLDEHGFQSYIAILGIDKPDVCVMFDDAEVAEQQQRVEALDRSALDRDRQQVSVIKPSGSVGTAGRAANTVIRGNADEVFSPPEGGSVARQDEAEARQLRSENGLTPGEAPAAIFAGTEPMPEAPMRGQRRGR